MAARQRTITLDLDQWSDVVSALHWTQREILSEGAQRAAFSRIEQSINRQLAPDPDDAVPFCPDDPSVCCVCWNSGIDHVMVGKYWTTVACRCECGRTYHAAHPHLGRAA